MVQTVKATTPTAVRCVVLRPICIKGARVEVGTAIELTTTQYTEAAAAGKVGPYVAPTESAEAPKKTHKPHKEAQS